MPSRLRPRIARLLGACLLGGLMAAPARADAPFAQPVKDCHPCRFSPGPGQPDFDLTFVFEGSGETKTLAALAIVPAGGGSAQRLDAGGLAVADFPDGFTLDTPALAPDGPRGLSIVTQIAADNTNALYWIYDPGTRRFAPLERVGDDGSQAVLSVGPGHLLSCRVRGSIIEYATYEYRLSGHRAVAVRKDSREIDGALIVDTSTDLAARPPRLTARAVVGFSGDSPARAAFLRRLDAASARAAVLYRRGDPAAAAAAVAAAVKGVMLGLATSSYPVTDDPGDQTLVRQFNDYGFYLEQAGRPVPAIAILSQVTDAAPGRAVAYLNLGDAQYAAGRIAEARRSYAAYRTGMAEAGKRAEIPPRVADRLR